MSQKKLHHGGDLKWAQKTFTYQGDDWLDLSTGINPVAYPIPPLAPETYTRLPDQSLQQQAVEAACQYYRALSVETLALAPGSQALIQWLPRLRARSCVAILIPTYQEHARCWGLAGHDVHLVDNLEKARELQPDVVIIVRPNNPTGSIVPATDIITLANELAGRDGWVIVDEAFADTNTENDLASWTDISSLILLKSFGKFFGLAGLRLGVTISNETLAGHIRDAVGPWAVPGPTLSVAASAFRDAGWIAETSRRLEQDAARLDRILSNADCTILGGTTLFRLVETERLQDLLMHLGNNGILVRPFPYNAKWLRFGLPGSEQDWERLTNCMVSFCS